MVTLLIILGIVVLTIMFVVGIFNRLVALKNRYENAFSQIEVQLKRRYDLIPNLVETAKGYMKHERETLDAVIQARNQASAGLARAAGEPGSAEAMQGLAGAEGVLSGAMARIRALTFPRVTKIRSGAFQPPDHFDLATYHRPGSHLRLR